MQLKTAVMISIALALVFLIGCKQQNGTSLTARFVDIPKQEASTQQACTDSDNGIVPAVKGKVVGFNGELGNVEEEDVCFAGFLIERFCDNNNPSNINLRCEKCREGICSN